MPTTRRRRGALGSTVAVVGALGVAAGLIALVAWLQRGSDNGSSTSSTTSSTLGPRAKAERDASQKWSSEAQVAFGGPGIAQRVNDLATGARDWQAGTLSQDVFKARLDDDIAAFTTAADAVAHLRPYPYDKRVNDIFRRTAALYLDSVRVYEAALVLRGSADDMAGSAGIRTQHDLLARRLRLVGDRIFDRGQALVDVHMHDAPTPAVDIRKPEEVPNWVAEGLAPGPPLDAAPPPPAAEPQLRQATRPQQPRADWLKAVDAANAPSADEVRSAIDAGDTARLLDLANRLVNAAENLRAAPDPKNDREESARLRLSLLVEADAARAAQLNPALTDVARDVLAAGAGLA